MNYLSLIKQSNLAKKLLFQRKELKPPLTFIWWRRYTPPSGCGEHEDDDDVHVNINIDIAFIVNQLFDLALDNHTAEGSEERCVFLGINKPLVRSIGERLNSLGGFMLMLNAYNSLKDMAIHPLDLRELECAWHNIGEWRS